MLYDVVYVCLGLNGCGFSGGGSLLSRREREEIHAEVDVEFEAREGVSKKQKGKRIQKRSHSYEDDPGSLFGDGIAGKLPKFANRISLKVSDFSVINCIA